jgi:hypothetical protein
MAWRSRVVKNGCWQQYFDGILLIHCAGEACHEEGLGQDKRPELPALPARPPVKTFSAIFEQFRLGKGSAR